MGELKKPPDPTFAYSRAQQSLRKRLWEKEEVAVSCLLLPLQAPAPPKLVLSSMKDPIKD